MLRKRFVHIALAIGISIFIFTFLIDNADTDQLVSCVQPDISAMNDCLSHELGNTPYMLLKDDKYVAWSNEDFISSQLTTREVRLSHEVVLRYQVNSPITELIRFIGFLIFIFSLSLTVIRPADTLNSRKYHVLWLTGIVISILTLTLAVPNGISPTSFGPVLWVSGLLASVAVFGVHFLQQLPTRSRESQTTAIATLSALLILAFSIMYFHSKTPFLPSAATSYLIMLWLVRIILSLSWLTIGYLFIKILYKCKWPLLTRIAGYGALILLTFLITGYLTSWLTGLLLASVHAIILLLLDLVVEESRINFLWMVIWAMTISVLNTVLMFIFGGNYSTTVPELFNYFSICFAGMMLVTTILLLCNTYLWPSLSFGRLKLPRIYLLRHKVEFFVMGTLMMSFLAIGAMTYLLESEEFRNEQDAQLTWLKQTDSIDVKNMPLVVGIDSFINGIELASGISGPPSFMPFRIYQHFQNKKGDFLQPPFIYKRIDDELVVRLGPDETTVLNWYNQSSLSRFLNIYVFLFIIAIGLLYLFTNQLTRPLQLLARQLYNIDIGKENKRIEWKNEDEIGHLIHQYNNMLDQLDESANILAQSERDHAWREMAKQVAHEIKNPLTPMKLTIQHLQRNANQEDTAFSNQVTRASNTLVEQIENLTRIADNFSRFGQMPSASNDKVLLNEVVTSVHDLFRKREDINIQCIVPIDDLFIFSDKDHLIRILNNIVKNAIQAIPHHQKGEIEIKLIKNHHDAVISIKDNGIGIAEEQKTKVFQPNFTTKSSGTGLGLAMCSKLVESMNGKIYFDTEVEIGTTFYVQIPLMRIDANYLPETDIVK
ncbi:MAG: HAMP domain-containing sensor histidine kinase [Saprospiraceae bacterium]|nr:HAMP domain-containing sensor histidine kinase [Saprospiraceae bacterium]